MTPISCGMKHDLPRGEVLTYLDSPREKKRRKKRDGNEKSNEETRRHSIQSNVTLTSARTHTLSLFSAAQKHEKKQSKKKEKEGIRRET